MFSSLADHSTRSLDAVRRTLRSSQAIYELQRTFVSDGTTLSIEVESLLAQVPAVTESRVYEHCSAITRIYAVYESYVEELLSAWLDYVPKIWPNYSDVDEGVRLRHRDGVASVLARLNHRRYEHLREQDVAVGFAAAFTSPGGYKLLAEAFIHRDSNLRFDALCNVFSGAGVGGLNKWKRGGRLVSTFLATSAEADETISALIDELVAYRNDAAHGSPDEILSMERLIFFCDLIERLIIDLGSYVARHTIQALLNCDLATKIAVATEIFPRAGAVVAVLENAGVCVGDELLLLTSHGASRIKVESVRWFGRSINGVFAGKPVEVGLAFNCEVLEKCALVRI